jgi:hypothetical protein
MRRRGPAAGRCGACDVDASILGRAAAMDSPLDPGPGGRVGPLQPRAAVALENFVDRGVQAQVVSDPSRSPPAADAQPENPSLGPPGQLMWAAMRSRGPIHHAGGPEPSVAISPATRGSNADRESFGARADVQPWTTTSRASFSRPVGVRVAFGWVACVIEDLRVLRRSGCVVAPHLTRRSTSSPSRHAVPHVRGQNI